MARQKVALNTKDLDVDIRTVASLQTTSEAAGQQVTEPPHRRIPQEKVRGQKGDSHRMNLDQDLASVTWRPSCGSLQADRRLGSNLGRGQQRHVIPDIDLFN